MFGLDRGTAIQVSASRMANGGFSILHPRGGIRERDGSGVDLTPPASRDHASWTMHRNPAQAPVGVAKSLGLSKSHAVVTPNQGLLPSDRLLVAFRLLPRGMQHLGIGSNSTLCCGMLYHHH